MYNRLYGEVTVDENEPLLHYGIVHLGKHRGGWKIQWNPNIYEKQIIRLLPRTARPMLNDFHQLHYMYINLIVKQ